jgi:hypothetical protein
MDIQKEIILLKQKEAEIIEQIKIKKIKDNENMKIKNITSKYEDLDNLSLLENIKKLLYDYSNNYKFKFRDLCYYDRESQMPKNILNCDIGPSLYYYQINRLKEKGEWKYNITYNTICDFFEEGKPLQKNIILQFLSSNYNDPTLKKMSNILDDKCPTFNILLKLLQIIETQDKEIKKINDKLDKIQDQLKIKK